MSVAHSTESRSGFTVQEMLLWVKKKKNGENVRTDRGRKVAVSRSSMVLFYITVTLREAWLRVQIFSIV